MTYVILTAGIDLSVGSILALATSLVAMWLARGYTTHIVVAILGAVIASGSVGALSGAVIAFTRGQPFIATLAAMIGVCGLAKWISSNQKIDIGFGHELSAEIPGTLRSKG